jgi:endonuclease/exonuclease/phosphatase family metal-dependent hydrolase
MKLTIGTFNLNNLFSRYNFKANISKIKKPVDGPVVYSFENQDTYKIRKFNGKVVKPKPYDETVRIADTIKAMNIDVLAVQEVEDINILKQFNQYHLGTEGFDYVALIEGNDQRLIDVGLLSKYPIGGVTSWRFAWYIDENNKKEKNVFSRDLLQVDIYNASRSSKLLTIFNTHLKSNYVSYDSDNPEDAMAYNNLRRSKQAATIGRIIESETRPNSRYVLVGDMNDSVDSENLHGYSNNPELNMTNALEDMQEIGKMNYTKYPPPDKFWTHRYNETPGIYTYKLYDQIWVSPSLTPKLTGAWVKRRKRVGGDGSDHDPVWIELNL